MFAACMKDPQSHLPWVHFCIARKQIPAAGELQDTEWDREELSKPQLASEPRSDVSHIKVGQPNVQHCGPAQAPAHKLLYQMLVFLEKTRKDPWKSLQRFPVPCLATIWLHLLFTHLMASNFLGETSPPQVGDGRHTWGAESSTVHTQGKPPRVGMFTPQRWVWKSSKWTCLQLGMCSLPPTAGCQELPPALYSARAGSTALSSIPIRKAACKPKDSWNTEGGRSQLK